MIDPNQQSFDKKTSPLWSQAELLVWAKPLSASLLPASAGWGSGSFKQHGKPSIQRGKKKTKNSPICWGSWDGEARQQIDLLGVEGITPLATRCRGKGKDAALGCSPGMFPQWPHHPPSMARGDIPIPCERKMWPGSIPWGDLKKFLEISMIWNSIFHWERFWELGGEKEAGRKIKNIGRRSSLPKL